MDKETAAIAAVEPLTRLQKSPARLEQPVRLVADVNGNAEIIVGLEKVDDFIGEMMDVHHSLVHTGLYETTYDNLKHGDAPYPYQSLGVGVRERFQPCAFSGCENQSTHTADKFTCKLFILCRIPVRYPARGEQVRP